MAKSFWCIGSICLYCFEKESIIIFKRQTLVHDIYIDAVETFMIKILNKITYVNSRKISKVICSSFKLGDTVLKCRQKRKESSKVMSEAFNNALIKIMKSGVRTKSWIEQYRFSWNIPEKSN